MSRPINPISQAGEFIVRTFKPRGDVAYSFSSLAKNMKNNFEGPMSSQFAMEDLKGLGRTMGAYFAGRDGVGRGTVALRALGGLAALQGTSRVLRGGAPWKDETTGRLDAPGLPFI